MEQMNQSDWAIYTYLENGKIKKEIKRPVFNFMLTALGTGLAYSFGMTAGDLISTIPFIKENLPDLAKSTISTPQFGASLGGLMGIIWGMRGFKKSGIKVNWKNLELKEFCLYPFHLKYQGEKNSQYDTFDLSIKI